MPLNEEVAELRAKFEAHDANEQKWQERVDVDLTENRGCHSGLKAELGETKGKVDKVYEMIKWAIVGFGICLPVVTGLLVYIFQTHHHNGVSP